MGDTILPCLLPQLPEKPLQHRPAGCPLRPQMVQGRALPPGPAPRVSERRCWGMELTGPIRTSAGSQQVVQPDGHVTQLVQCEGGVPTGVLTQTAPVVIDQGPVVPSHAGGQGPGVQGEILRPPRPLPQVEQTFTHRSTLGRVVKVCPEAAGEFREVIQRRISFSPHGVGPLQSSP